MVKGLYSPSSSLIETTVADRTLPQGLIEIKDMLNSSVSSSKSSSNMKVVMSMQNISPDAAPAGIVSF